MSLSHEACVSGSRASHAARMSANSVLPPRRDARACSSEYFAGAVLYELSECQSRLPSWNSRWRSSRSNTRSFLSRFDTSANVVGIR